MLLPHAVAFTIGGIALLGVMLICLVLWNRRLQHDRERLRQTERTLQEEEQRLRFVLEAISDAVWDWDVYSGEVRRSDSWWRMLGYEPKTGPGMLQNFEALIHPDDFHTLQTQLDALINNKQRSISLEIRLKNAAGDWQWVLCRGRAMQHDDAGRATRVIGALTDIHSRKQAQAGILEQKELLENIIATIPLQVYWKDARLRYLGCNAQFLKERCLPSTDAILGQTDSALGLISGDGARQTMEQTVLNSGAPIMDLQEDFTCRPGGARTLLVNLLPLHDQNGNPMGVLGICSDVTDQRAMETALHAAKNKADAANEAKSQFLAAMSHEIRTPMNAIMGMTEMLTESQLNRDQQGFVRVLAAAGETLMSIINNVLDLSRVESGQMPLDIAPFRIRELFNRLETLFAIKARSKSLSLTFTIAPELTSPLLGDVIRLQQILVNLIENALKFTHSGGIEVAASLAPQQSDQTQILLKVADTGVGIPEDLQQQVFERFIQADASITRKYGGSGLGLSLCKELARALGGRIWLESQEQQGATFFVILPMTVLDESAIPAPPAPSALPEEESSPAPCHVLLVEDSEYNAFVVASYLKGTTCRITLAPHGQEGLARFAEGEYDLVLMDMQMPVMDGYSATKAIRSLEAEQNRPPTPIVAMTAHAFAEERAKSLEAGCNAHLVKPVSRRLVLETISAYTGKPVRRLSQPEEPWQLDAQASEAPAPSLPDLPACLPEWMAAEDDSSPIPICIDPEIKAIAPQFLASVRKKIAPYLKRITPDDMESLARIGHQLKGEGAAFGFSSLGDQGMQLEIAAIQGDSGAALAILQRMQAFLARVVVA